ncbi:LppM family (lipo)protein [Bogoriella caseilytica]|nr:hypothetical protein [Bogoriella caseilytica]
MTRTRRGIAAAIAVLLTATLSGCFRLHMDAETTPEDTVNAVVIAAVSDEVRQAMDATSMFGDLGDLSEMLGDSAGLIGSMDPADMLPPATSEEPYSADGYTGSILTYENVPFEDFSFEGFEISREGEEHVVRGQLDLGGSGLSDLTEGMLSELTEGLPIPGGMLSGLGGGGYDIEISMTFPGRVEQHTGELDGTTVTWEATSSTEIYARASADPDTAPMNWTWLIWTLVVLAVLAVVFFIVRWAQARRRQRAEHAALHGPEGAPQADFPASPYENNPGFAPAPGAPGSPQQWPASAPPQPAPAGVSPYQAQQQWPQQAPQEWPHGAPSQPMADHPQQGTSQQPPASPAPAEPAGPPPSAGTPPTSPYPDYPTAPPSR